MSEVGRTPSGWERHAPWLLLALSVVGFVSAAIRFVLQWQALSAGDVQGLAQPALSAVAAALLLCAWILAIALTARLRHWVWLVACLLLPVAIPAFAVVALVEPRPRRTDARRRAAFEASMAGGSRTRRPSARGEERES